MPRRFRKYNPDAQNFDFQNPQSRVTKKKEKEDEYLQMFDPDAWKVLTLQRRERVSFTSPSIARMYTPYRPLYRDKQKTSMKESSIPVKPTDVRKRKLQLD